jgi:hypothetical protein
LSQKAQVVVRNGSGAVFAQGDLPVVRSPGFLSQQREECLEKNPNHLLGKELCTRLAA